MNLGEYGVVFRFNASFNLAAFTALSLVFEKPSGATLTRTNPQVTVGGVDVATPLGTFLTNEYVNYTWLVGEVDEAGEWCVQLTYTDASKLLKSEIAHFTVANPAC